MFALLRPCHDKQLKPRLNARYCSYDDRSGSYRLNKCQEDNDHGPPSYPPPHLACVDAKFSIAILSRRIASTGAPCPCRSQCATSANCSSVSALHSSVTRAPSAMAKRVPTQFTKRTHLGKRPLSFSLLSARIDYVVAPANSNPRHVTNEIYMRSSAFLQTAAAKRLVR